MKKIDKVSAKRLEVFGAVEDRPGFVYAWVWYDVRKLRRLDDEEVREILFKKTLMLYPFAIIERQVSRVKAYGRTHFGIRDFAVIEVVLPLSPGLHLKKVSEEE